jgi:hypothetical protein
VGAIFPVSCHRVGAILPVSCHSVGAIFTDSCHRVGAIFPVSCHRVGAIRGTSKALGPQFRVELSIAVNSSQLKRPFSRVFDRPCASPA